MRYFKILACKIFQRELAQVLLTCPNALDITFMRQDLHTNENRFGDIEAILLGYGLCSNALAGIKSSRLPLVIPRAHDCITYITWPGMANESGIKKANAMAAKAGTNTAALL